MFEKMSKRNDLNREFSDAMAQWDIDKIKNLFKDGNEDYPDINQELVSAPAILLAAIKGNWDMFEKLYELNADLDVKTINNGWHVIHECVKNAPSNILSGIIEYCDLDVQTDDGKTALMVAIKDKNQTNALALLDNKNITISLCDKNGDNAAHYAARSGMNELFLRLIKEGVPLNQKNKKGKVPADLIEDEFFKSSIPSGKEEEREFQEKSVYKAYTKDKTKDKPKEVTGLSKIKKNF